MSMPPEIQTFLVILATDLRMASDRIPLDQARDPYTGQVNFSRPALKERLKKHADECERLADEIGRARASTATQGAPEDLY